MTGILDEVSNFYYTSTALQENVDAFPTRHGPAISKEAWIKNEFTLEHHRLFQEYTALIEDHISGTKRARISSLAHLEPS